MRQTAEDIAIHRSQSWSAFGTERQLPSTQARTNDRVNSVVWTRLIIIDRAVSGRRSRDTNERLAFHGVDEN